MSLSDVFFVGPKVFITAVFTKSPGQSGTPVTVTAVMILERPDGTVVTPAPTVTVVTTLGVATATASYDLPDTNAASAGMWKFRITTAGDLIAVREDVFYVLHSAVL
jgi:hypothetical protein